MVPYKIFATTARAILLARYKQKPARQGPRKQLAAPVASRNVSMEVEFLIQSSWGVDPEDPVLTALYIAQMLMLV